MICSFKLTTTAGVEAVVLVVEAVETVEVNAVVDTVVDAVVDRAVETVVDSNESKIHAVPLVDDYMVDLRTLLH